MLKPGEIPQYTGNLDQLEIDHADLRKDAGHVRKTGGDVHSRFQGLSAYYTAPEAEQLFATTKPVQDRADTFADDLETVSSALSSYATEIRPLVDKLKQLKTDATTFVSSVKDDDEWEYDENKIEEHNQLRDEITATVAAFWAAERTAHNKITALWGGTQMVAGDGSDRKDQYGFAADDMKNAKVPWGDPVEEKHHWYEVGHWVKSFVWDGLIIDGVWGTLKGLGTLVGFGGWDAMGQAWKGLAQLATGLTISMMPGAQVLFWGLPDDKLPAWLRDSRTAMKETGKALLAWDEWGKNPARAAGAVTFNVLTTVFTGGAGAGVSGAGKAGAAAKVLSAAGKTARVIDPMTYIAKGAGAGLSKIGDISAALKGVGNIDIPTLPDNAITLPEGAVKLPDGTVNLPEGATIPDGATRLPDGNIKLPHDTLALPPGTTKLPSVDGSPAHYMDGDGNLLDQHGNVIDNVDNAPTDVVDKPASGTPAEDADVPRVDSPPKEPALVGAGAHTAEQAGQHIRLGNSAGNNLGDVGRVGDNAAVHAGGDSVPTVHAGGDGVPGGYVGDLPGGSAVGHVPGGTADHLPGGRADDLGTGPTASHETPNGQAGSHGDGTGSEQHGHTASNHGGSDMGGHGDGRNGPGDHARSDHTSGHPGEGGSLHGHEPHVEPHIERDVRDPRGSVADDTARRDAEPIQLGDEPLPAPSQGENVLGQIPESRVQRNTDGLITHVDGRNFEHFLKDLSFQRGAAFREAKELGTLSRRKVGPCAGQVMDLRTGKIVEAINGRPEDLIENVHPTIADRYENLPDPTPAPDEPLRHAEVKAVNSLLWERAKLGLPDGAEALAELRAAMEFPYFDHMRTELPGRPAAFCANCDLMLDGVDSLHGRFTGTPTDENWIP
ncbi:YwqJ-related putative deaminase [Streptomyces sp. NBC_01352]|uniref:YwqJ-related putative deaminase n=1 Tax=Streptomyces sp. NBC_01352 TaxID=2903834 RepID=UPI002E372575|nr:YwqJ-related putative deaminase [Streptomyces sp. NBC_01352]